MLAFTDTAFLLQDLETYLDVYLVSRRIYPLISHKYLK